MLSSILKERGGVVAGDSSPVTLLSMAHRRAPTPGAQWSLRVAMLPEDKVAIYNRQRSAEGQLTMLNVSSLSVRRRVQLKIRRSL